MKQTHDNDYQNQEELEKILDVLSVKKEFDKKTRINLYIPRIIVKLMDSLTKDKSRGELVSTLVVKEAQKNRKIPYGLFSPLEISDKEIDEISAGWDKTVNELA